MNKKTRIRKIIVLSLSCLMLTSCTSIKDIFKKDKEDSGRNVSIVKNEEKKTYKQKEGNNEPELKGPKIGVKATYPVKIVGKDFGDGLVVSDGSIMNLTNNPVQILSANMKYIIPDDTVNGEKLDYKPDPMKDWYAQFRLRDNQTIYAENDLESSQTLSLSVQYPKYTIQGYGDSATNISISPEGYADIYSFGGTSRVFIDNKDPGTNIPLKKVIVSSTDTSRLAAEIIDDSVVIAGNLNHVEIQVDYGDGNLNPFYLETDADEIVIKVDENGNLLGYRINPEAQNTGEGFISKIINKPISMYTRNVPIEKAEEYKYY